MKEKTEKGGTEVQGIEMIDLGDAVVETKQFGTPMVSDSCCTFTWGPSSA